jgi:hypothetical protein
MECKGKNVWVMGRVLRISLHVSLFACTSVVGGKSFLNQVSKKQWERKK